jgi:hypothetical protein
MNGDAVEGRGSGSFLDISGGEVDKFLHVKGAGFFFQIKIMNI